MKRLLPVLALVATFATAQADDAHRYSLAGKPGLPMPEQEVGKDGIARVKKVTEGSLEVFPAAQQPSQGTIIICPGGGYSILAIDHEGRDVARMLNEAGWDAAVLAYHVSEGDQTRTLALADAKGAVTLVQQHGKELGVNNARLGFMGFSAGGHLAARTLHELGSTGGLAFGVLIYPAYLEKEGKVLEEVLPPGVPTFLCVAGNDKYAPSAQAYAALCQEKGIPHEFYAPAEGGHGFGLKKDLPESVRAWPEKLKAFLAGLPAAK